MCFTAEQLEHWHLVPSFPPEVNGLGDYAFRLSAALGEVGNRKSRFLVADALWSGSDPRVHVLADKRNLHNELISLGVQNLLVHYVNYGYAKRGCPFWLIKGLSQWKKHAGMSVLNVFMHELFVRRSYPWKSAYWLAPMQRLLAHRLVTMADRTVTSNEAYASWIDAQRQKTGPTLVIPVFSNIGEPKDIIPWQQRKPFLVLFGREATRRNAYANIRKSYPGFFEDFGIKRVTEIGPGRSVVVSSGQIDTVFLGILSSKAISEILLESRFGALDTSQGPLPKSGVLAALAAHGAIPVAGGKTILWDAFPQEFCVTSNTDRPSDEVSHDLIQWYNGHRVAIAAKKLLSL